MIGPRGSLVYDVRTQAAHAAFAGVAVNEAHASFVVLGARHASKYASQIVPPSAPRHAAEGSAAGWYLAGKYVDTSEPRHEVAASAPAPHDPSPDAPGPPAPGPGLKPLVGAPQPQAEMTPARSTAAAGHSPNRHAPSARG